MNEIAATATAASSSGLRRRTALGEALRKRPFLLGAAMAAVGILPANPIEVLAAGHGAAGIGAAVVLAAAYKTRLGVQIETRILEARRGTLEI